jgi:UDP-glucuronate 4-epimerase
MLMPFGHLEQGYVGTTLITGAAGFIGSHVARRLLAQDERLLLVDNFNDFYDPALKRANAAPLHTHPLATFVETDIRDADAMQRLFAEHQIERVCHLAAMNNVRASIERAPLYVEVNLNGTLNLLEAARKHSVRLFMLASTSSVYGNSAQIPFVETDPADRPLASYPASKRAAEMIAHSYTNLFNLPVTVLRFFNVYGPNGRPDMMPLKVLDALTHGKTIDLYDGGELQRDWTYIDDIVDGVLASLEKPLGYEIMNLGFGAPSTLNAFIEILETLTGCKAMTRHVPAPDSEHRISYCDNSKARDLLGFAPRTPLHEGLAQTWAWYKEARLK